MNSNLLSLRLFLAIVIVISLVACGGSSPDESASQGNPTTESKQTEIVASEQENIEESTKVTEPTNTSVPTNTPTPTDTPEPTGTPTPTPLPPTPTPPPIGLSRSNPHPITKIVNAPNWDIQVLEIVKGEEAWKAIQSANQFNDPPHEETEYILVKIYAKNTSVDDEARSIDSSDFRVTGDRYIRYSSASVVEPDPQLDAQLFTGGETEGWVAFEVAEGETNLILIIDELFNFDENRLRFVELGEGASVSIPEELAEIQPTDLGIERSNPAPFGETITTEDWEVILTDVVRGDDAWTMVQDANQFNDPPEEGMEYIAVKVFARYISTVDDAESIDGSYFKSTGDASVIHDSPSVVDPEPKLDVSLYPGGESEGWIIVQSALGETGMKLIFEPIFDFSGNNKRHLSIEP